METGVTVILVVAFAVFLLVMAMQPVANINPTAINRANGTIGLIGVMLHDVCSFFTNSMLQGTEALQSGLFVPWVDIRLGGIADFSGVGGYAGPLGSRTGMIDRENRCSFHADRAIYPAPLCFAIQKRTLAFYSSMEIAPFGLNRGKNAYYKNLC